MGLEIGRSTRQRWAKWAGEHLLGTWHNTALTIVGVVLIYLVLRFGLSWLLDGNWRAVTDVTELILVGQYPSDERWRVAVAALAIPVVIGLAWGTWEPVFRPLAITFAVVTTASAVLFTAAGIADMGTRLWLTAGLPALVAGRALAAAGLGTPRGVTIVWLASFAGALLLMRGFGTNAVVPSVPTKSWGGLMLTVVLAGVTITMSLPLAVALAYGRRSRSRFISAAVVSYVETLRGIPPLILLAFAQVMVPMALPEGMAGDRVSRAIVALVAHTSAHLAEVLRGGLQGVPRAHLDTAAALGLKRHRIAIHIELPQALRMVLPGIVGQLITLFKDTALVSIVGLHDFLGMARRMLSPVDSAHMLALVGAVYWLFASTLARVGAALERAMRTDSN